MDRRREKRVKQRVVCDLWINGERFTGIVLDRSAHGLFVKTNAVAEPGTEVKLQLKGGRSAEDEELAAYVVRNRVVPQRLNRIATGGMGLHIPHGPVRNAREFQVRIKQVKGPRTRNIRVAGESEDEAREAAMAQLGEEWSILEISLA